MDILEEVNNWIADNVSADCSERELLEQLAEHGCQSGMVAGLIYYSDTCAFYERHKAEIGLTLRDVLDDCGCSVREFFGKKWDDCDPLANETGNKNLLAWFAFEEVARRKGGF